GLAVVWGQRVPYQAIGCDLVAVQHVHVADIERSVRDVLGRAVAGEAGDNNGPAVQPRPFEGLIDLLLDTQALLGRFDSLHLLAVRLPRAPLAGRVVRRDINYLAEPCGRTVRELHLVLRAGGERVPV